MLKNLPKKLVITAALKGKKAFIGKKVIFKFNGKAYIAKTNSKGIAKVIVKNSVLKKLKVGKAVKYQVTYLRDTVTKIMTLFEFSLTFLNKSGILVARSCLVVRARQTRRYDRSYS